MNYLDEEDYAKKETRNTLKMLRKLSSSLRSGKLVETTPADSRL